MSMIKAYRVYFFIWLFVTKCHKIILIGYYARFLLEKCFRMESNMKKINMAIMAAGGIAGTMAATINRMEEIHCYAVASRSLEKAEKFASQYGFEKAYGSYEELVEDEKVDLIYIASPHSEHYSNMKLCINHGKNVLCEKSFTVNEKQAAEVFTLAKEKKVLVTEAMWVRYMPMAKTLQEILASDMIGDISTVTSNLHYSIDSIDRIRNPKLAGGALLDVGIYALTFASLVMGDEIEKVTSSCTKFDTGVDAQNAVIINYKDGKMAVCNSGTSAIGDRKGIIYGRKGFIIVENINNFESIKVFNDSYQLVQEWKATEQISGYEYEVLACKKAIEKGMLECTDCTHKSILKMIHLMDVIRKQLGIEYPFE